MKRLAEKTTGFMAEFRKFIARGNVLDMAVGVIIGGAFGKISTSLVNDVLMPAISMLTGGIDFTDWKLVLKEAVTWTWWWKSGSVRSSGGSRPWPA